MPLMPTIRQGRYRVYRREGVGEQGQGERRDDRGTDSLQRAGGDQEPMSGASAAPADAAVKSYSGDEHAPAAEAVAERGAGQEQDAVSST